MPSLQNFYFIVHCIYRPVGLHQFCYLYWYFPTQITVVQLFLKSATLSRLTVVSYEAKEEETSMLPNQDSLYVSTLHEVDLQKISLLHKVLIRECQYTHFRPRNWAKLGI